METVKIDFPDRDLFILKDGDWRGFRSHPCAKEPETIEWIRSFDEGDPFWDIGASVGPYTLIAAALRHYVVAFEPFYPSLGHLQQNIWLNDLSRFAMPSPFALGTEIQNAVLYCSSPHPGAASHGYEPDDRLQQFVSVITADGASNLYGHKPELVPKHVKIDVDGAELGVIEGGRKLWPIVDSILVESEVPTIDDITVILQAAGLEMVSSHKRQGETKQHNYIFKRV